MDARRRLHQNGRKIAGTVQDSDNLERFLFRIIDDQVLRIWMHNPKAHRKWGQVFSGATGEWRVGEEIASPKHCFFNLVR